MQRSLMAVARRAMPLARSAARPATRRVARPAMGSARWMSSNEEADLEKRIREMDAKVVAAEAKAAEVVELPLRVSGKSGNYAAGLFRAAVKSGNFAAACEQLQAFNSALGQVDPFVRRVFESSSFAPEDCWEALNLLVGGAKITKFDALSETAQTSIVEDEVNVKKFQDAQKAFSKVKLGEEVGMFLAALCEGGNLNLFNRSKNVFFNLVKAAGNGVDVRVVSAVDLSAAQVKKVEKLLPSYLDGAVPIVSYEVDPTVLGGVQIQVGNTLAEATSDGVLRQVSQTFAQN